MRRSILSFRSTETEQEKTKLNILNSAEKSKTLNQKKNTQANYEVPKLIEKLEAFH